MAGKVYIGIAGWSYPDWKGIVYTQPGIDQLEYVSGFVDCIEINSTFYRPPSEKNSTSWLKRTSKRPEFFFTAKLNRDFTHEGKIDAGMVKQFHTGFGPLLEANKLKHLLVQFRYDFADCKDNRRLLAQIVKNFSGTFELAVEVRHKSWQQEGALKFLEGLGVSVCNLDYPTTYNSFDMQHCTVGKAGYFRLHGRNEEKWFSKSSRDETYDYYYNRDELDQIKQRIDKLANAFETLTIIANNHYRGAELANALELKALLSGQKQLVPEGLLKAYPNLAKIVMETDNSQLKFWR
ncbi:MAG: DUF72 domain-containing protein [Phycisphaerae bacterium]|nr:DUF72 domain-containing protein [Phycisphaerae bacterium]NIP54293.1 DUF72 domain-containing protein [Phycisphaerae bacterium]NIS53162.1 DUF72 domain-containing protein [Phycisphaerae bacterium]NIU10647.1 DUF72 domain-containing protein [Phycisphaerae bacterium]NIU58408.1 DUF72 domain-containing protein [Phycisphaerae bacterium]